MKEYELMVKYDGRKSFYNKARIKETDEEIMLISYNTHVATIDKVKGKAFVFGIYSTTTLRHIKEFLQQNGFQADTKKQIKKDYIESELNNMEE